MVLNNRFISPTSDVLEKYGCFIDDEVLYNPDKLIMGSNSILVGKISIADSIKIGDNVLIINNKDDVVTISEDIPSDTIPTMVDIVMQEEILSKHAVDISELPTLFTKLFRGDYTTKTLFRLHLYIEELLYSKEVGEIDLDEIVEYLKVCRDTNELFILMKYLIDSDEGYDLKHMQMTLKTKPMDKDDIILHKLIIKIILDLHDWDVTQAYYRGDATTGIKNALVDYCEDPEILYRLYFALDNRLSDGEYTK